MGVKFTPKFTIAGVIADVNKRIKTATDILVDRLRQVGEQFIADARNDGSYTDRTGNLRSSIGYVIYKDGQPFEEAFPGDKEQGKERGKEVAAGLDVPKKGYCLVVVAGMNYAVYVEAKNYDVITGSSFEAERNLKQAIDFVRKNL
ncbi:MAG: hypothetical protein ACTHLB_05490 [Parafilimonas sp.]